MLTSINSQAENDYVTSLIPDSSNAPTLITPGVLVWIGGLRTTSRYSWIDGSRWGYTNWNHGEPNNDNDIEDKIHMYGKGYGIPEGKWNDAPHSHKMNGLVCSYKP